MAIHPSAGGLLLLFSAQAVAGRVDYSRLSDEELYWVVISITGMLIGFAALGLLGWLRYRQHYTPAPGRFTPLQALFCVLAFTLLLILSCWFYAFRM